MSYAKSVYHRLVPERIRNPIGLWRRQLLDRLQRAATRLPVPPRDLLANIQMTPWAHEYLGVGRRSARSIVQQLELANLSTARAARVLDFGCGSGRILRYLKDSAWELHGCDVDRDAVHWSERALPFARLAVCSSFPPLPYSEQTFDIVLAVSVFTHFSPEEQQSWAAELARVMRPSGVLVLSTMGPSVLGNFAQLATAANQNRLLEEGSLYVRSNGAFNASAAFHTPGALVKLLGGRFVLLRWLERGLDGFQDLTLLRRV